MSDYICPIFHITDEEPDILLPKKGIKKIINLSNSEDYYLKTTNAKDVNFTEYDDIEDNLKNIISFFNLNKQRVDRPSPFEIDHTYKSKYYIKVITSKQKIDELINLMLHVSEDYLSLIKSARSNQTFESFKKPFGKYPSTSDVDVMSLFKHCHGVNEDKHISYNSKLRFNYEYNDFREFYNNLLSDFNRDQTQEFYICTAYVGKFKR